MKQLFSIYSLNIYNISLIKIIDLLAVSLLLYKIYRLIRGSIAVRISIGLLLIYLLYIVVKALKMELLTAVMGKVIDVGFIVPIVLFQQEVRRFLSVVGGGILWGQGKLIEGIIWGSKETKHFDIATIIKTVQVLGGSNTGALIVLSKNADLKFYADSGDFINATVSKRLLIAIFSKHSPLHDGAVIIYNNKIVTARCILPVTENKELPAHFGLRHLSAIGMSESTDTLVLVVSEESGQISIAYKGKMESNLSQQEIRSSIKHYLDN